MGSSGTFMAAVGQTVELIGALLVLGAAWRTLRQRGADAGASTWADVTRIREVIAEMVATSGVGWGVGTIAIGLVLATIGSWMQV
jgi:hypothetical protein